VLEASLKEGETAAWKMGDPITLASRQGREGTLVVFTVGLKELTSLLDVLEHVLKGPEAALSATIAEPTPAGLQR
jgi:hypothetical protein